MAHESETDHITRETIPLNEGEKYWFEGEPVRYVGCSAAGPKFQRLFVTSSVQGIQTSVAKLRDLLKTGKVTPIEEDPEEPLAVCRAYSGGMWRWDIEQVSDQDHVIEGDARRPAVVFKGRVTSPVLREQNDVGWTRGTFTLKELQAHNAQRIDRDDVEALDALHDLDAVGLQEEGET